MPFPPQRPVPAVNVTRSCGGDGLPKDASRRRHVDGAGIVQRAIFRVMNARAGRFVLWGIAVAIGAGAASAAGADPAGESI